MFGKTHVVISYHLAREATASGIVRPLKTKSGWNFADVLTKALGNKPFSAIVNGFL